MSMGRSSRASPGRPGPSSASQRFLQRLWRNVVDEDTGEPVVVDVAADDATRTRVLHRTIDGVREDYEGLRLQHRHRQAHRAQQRT
jgi:leucyl-tRNA synthetase